MSLCHRRNGDQSDYASALFLGRHEKSAGWRGRGTIAGGWRGGYSGGIFRADAPWCQKRRGRPVSGPAVRRSTGISFALPFFTEKGDRYGTVDTGKRFV